MTGVCEFSAGVEDDVTVVYTGSLETCKDTVIATDTDGVVIAPGSEACRVTMAKCTVKNKVEKI